MNKKEPISNDRKAELVKAIKAAMNNEVITKTNLAKMLRVSPTYLSYMEKEKARHLIPNKFWELIEDWLVSEHKEIRHFALQRENNAKDINQNSKLDTIGVVPKDEVESRKVSISGTARPTNKLRTEQSSAVNENRVNLLRKQLEEKQGRIDELADLNDKLESGYNKMADDYQNMIGRYNEIKNKYDLKSGELQEINERWLKTDDHRAQLAMELKELKMNYDLVKQERDKIAEKVGYSIAGEGEPLRIGEGPLGLILGQIKELEKLGFRVQFDVDYGYDSIDKK